MPCTHSPPIGAPRVEYENLAHEIAALPQGAIRSDEEVLVRNVGRTYEEQLRRDSTRDGARAFKDRRKTDWPHHGL